MKKMLGWKPTMPLDMGLKRVYEWAKKELLGEFIGFRFL
jgi:nucleoside-diphosphate-sugar epimerase